MTAQKLQALATAGNWNPYYLAYALATCATDPDAAFARDGNNAEFMIWNNRMWLETCKREGLMRDHCGAHVNEHLATLASHI